MNDTNIKKEPMMGDYTCPSPIRPAYADEAEKRHGVIKELTQIVCKDRLQTHGNPENSFVPVAAIWNVILRKKLNEPITPLEVPAMMAAFKLARFTTTPTHRDNLLDAAGYAVCGAAMLPTQEKL